MVAEALDVGLVVEEASCAGLGVEEAWEMVAEALDLGLSDSSSDFSESAGN